MSRKSIVSLFLCMFVMLTVWASPNAFAIDLGETTDAVTLDTANPQNTVVVKLVDPESTPHLDITIGSASSATVSLADISDDGVTATDVNGDEKVKITKKVVTEPAEDEEEEDTETVYLNLVVNTSDTIQVKAFSAAHEETETESADTGYLGQFTITTSNNTGANSTGTLNAVQGNTSGKGRLIGVTTAMEYTSDNGATWHSIDSVSTDAAGNNYIEVNPGTYKVRFKSLISTNTVGLSANSTTSSAINAVDYYGIYVAGKELTSAYTEDNRLYLASDAGDAGYAWYDATKKILFLEDAVIKTGHESASGLGCYGIDIDSTHGGESITIDFDGSTNIALTEKTGDGYSYSGIESVSSALALTGDGLTITLPEGKANCGIDCGENNLTITNSTTVSVDTPTGVSSEYSTNGVKANALTVSKAEGATAAGSLNVTVKDTHTDASVQTAGTINGIAVNTMALKDSSTATVSMDVSDDNVTGIYCKGDALTVDADARMDVTVKDSYTATGIKIDNSSDGVPNTGTMVSKGTVNITCEKTELGDAIGIEAYKLDVEGGSLTIDAGSAIKSSAKSIGLKLDNCTTADSKIIAGSGCESLILGSSEFAVYTDGNAVSGSIISKGASLTVYGDSADITSSYTGKDLSKYKQIKIEDGSGTVTGITIKTGPDTIKLGGSGTYTAEVTGTATDKTVTWSIQDNVAGVSVDETKGIVTVSKDCTASSFTLRATSHAKPSVSKDKTVSVAAAVAVDSVTLNYDPETMVVGQSITLHADVDPEDATDKTVAWSVSENTAAIEITPSADTTSCVVTAKTAYTGDIHVVAASHADPTKKDTFTITSVLSSVTLTKKDDIVFTSLSGIKAMQVTVYPESLEDQITWAITGNSGICQIGSSVDKTLCPVSPLAVGTTTVTASVTVGGVTKSAVFTVTVSNNDYAITYPSANNTLVWYYDNKSSTGLTIKTNIPASMITKLGVPSNVDGSGNILNIMDAKSYSTITTESDGTKIVIPYSWLKNNLVTSSSYKTVIVVYYGTGSNDYVYKYLYVRSIKDSPITGDQDMGIYGAMMTVSAITALGTAGYVVYNKKRKRENP